MTRAIVSRNNSFLKKNSYIIALSEFSFEETFEFSSIHLELSSYEIEDWLADLICSVRDFCTNHNLSPMPVKVENMISPWLFFKTEVKEPFLQGSDLDGPDSHPLILRREASFLFNSLDSSCLWRDRNSYSSWIEDTSMAFAF